MDAVNREFLLYILQTKPGPEGVLEKKNFQKHI